MQFDNIKLTEEIIFHACLCFATTVLLRMQFIKILQSLLICPDAFIFLVVK